MRLISMTHSCQRGSFSVTLFCMRDLNDQQEWNKSIRIFRLCLPLHILSDMFKFWLAVGLYPMTKRNFTIKISTLSHFHNLASEVIIMNYLEIVLRHPMRPECGCDIELWQFLLDIAKSMKEGERQFRCPVHQTILMATSKQRKAARLLYRLIRLPQGESLFNFLVDRAERREILYR